MSHQVICPKSLAQRALLLYGMEEPVYVQLMEHLCNFSMTNPVVDMLHVGCTGQYCKAFPGFDPYHQLYQNNCKVE